MLLEGEISVAVVARACPRTDLMQYVDCAGGAQWHNPAQALRSIG
jgi:hypothetical protein